MRTPSDPTPSEVETWLRAAPAGALVAALAALVVVWWLLRRKG